ncbi:hypothetical protein MMC14_010258, partial [Varicellaria rhodocarpa]|nr:hypothetical protein [Varicellaria rhodocarpa]
MSAKLPPVVRIKLFNCEECSPITENANLYRPFSSLEGEVWMQSPKELNINSIHMSLQGLESTRVVDRPAPVYDIVEHQSSERIDQNLEIESIQITDGLQNTWTYIFNFYFIIPPVSKELSHSVPAVCQSLPPSFQAGEYRINKRDQPKLYSQAIIQYLLQASIEYYDTAIETEVLRRVTASKDINILPYSEPPPPTNTSDYPDEFIASATSSLRLYRLTPRVGTLTASIEEPKPLVYSNSISTSATETTLRISLEGFTLNLERLQRLSIRVKSGIRAKTFYSAKPITCMPNQSDLALKSLLRLHDDVIKLEEQPYGKLEWEPSWSTLLRIQIAPAQALPPSFCSVLVARSHSLLTR